MRIDGAVAACRLPLAAWLTPLAACLLPLAGHSQSLHPRSLREAWAVQGDASSLIAPRAIALSDDCTVWVTGAGVWRWPCETNTPERLDPLTSDTTVALLRSGPVPQPAPARVPAMSRVLDDGTMRAWTMTLPQGLAEPRTTRSYVVTVRADGTVLDTLLRAPGLQLAFYASDVTFGAHIAPLQRRPFVLFLPGGGFLAGNNDHDRLDVYDAAGMRQRTVTLPLPEPRSVSRADRVAYADSVTRSMEREMNAMQYADSLRAVHRAELARMLRDVEYPALRQRYDQLAFDEREQVVWAAVPSAATSYARTWFVCALTTTSFCRTVSVPHQGAVLAAVVRDGVLYAIERPAGGAARVAKYVAN